MSPIHQIRYKKLFKLWMLTYLDTLFSPHSYYLHETITPAATVQGNWQSGGCSKLSV